MKSLGIVRRAVAKIELLERRRLLSATLLSQVPAQPVTAGQSATVNLGTYFNDPTVPGTAIEMQIAGLGNIPIALATSTPKTDANFLQYISSGEFADTVIQRSVPNFVLQGGGYTPDGNPINQFAPVQSEAGISNTAGTIAMALSTGPNSATNQWFINLGDNSQSLDGTADGGPFTVFGNVIYNGMNVANAIAAEPIIDGSEQTPALEQQDIEAEMEGQLGPWGTLPVVNYTGPNPSTSVIPAANLVTNDTVVVPALSYSVSVADPSVLTASITNGSLTLTPAAGIGSTTTNVTITATDLGGGTATSTFAVNIAAPGSAGTTAAVTIGTGAAKSVTYTDADGATGTITLKGPGTATVNFAGSGLTPTTTAKNTVIVSGSNAGITGITTTGTTGLSTLTITAKGGPAAINVGGITTDGLKAIVAKSVTLTGDVTSSSSIGSLAVAGATSGSIDVSAIGTFITPGTVSDNINLSGAGIALNKFTAGSISGGTWTVAGSVKSITAGTISGWTPDVTGSIASLTVSKGNLNGTLSAATIGSIKVKGNLTNTSINLTASSNDLANLSVTQQITGSSIIAAGNIGNVSAASLAGTSIDAGTINLGEAGQVLPNVPTDFATIQSIASVKLKTTAAGDSFSNSDIAAADIGKLSLGTIQTDNGGNTTGIGAEDIKSLSAVIGTKHLNSKNLNDPTQVTTILTDLGVSLGDFIIKIF